MPANLPDGMKEDGTPTWQGETHPPPSDPPRSLVCQLAPKGWWCSREGGHDGPCAARRDPLNLGEHIQAETEAEMVIRAGWVNLADVGDEALSNLKESSNTPVPFDTFSQMVKLTEEVGELAAQVFRGNIDHDGIGDVLLSVLVLARMANRDPSADLMQRLEEVQKEFGV